MPIGDIGALYDTDNVLTGSAMGFVAPVGTDEPDDSLTVFDPAIWVDPWVPTGATEQGWQINWNPNVNSIRIDEQPTAVDQAIDTADLTFVANLAEDSVQSWQWALNGDKTVVAPGVSQFGKTIIKPNRKLKRYFVVLESQSKSEMPVRWIVPEMTCAVNVGSTFRRGTGPRLVPVTFSSVCNFDDIQRVEITADHS